MQNIEYSLIISIIAIAGTLFTYCKHDRKIIAQEKLINDYQLEKIKKERIQKNKLSLKHRF